MSNAATHTQEASESLVQRFLGRALSARVKKLIFLSSLAAYMDNITNPDNVVVNNLNELFSLSRNSSALKLPMQLHSKLWSDFDQKQLREMEISCDTLCELRNLKLSIPQLRIVANRLIRHMPKWLMYASKKKIEEDIFKLMRNADKLTQSSTPQVHA